VIVELFPLIASAMVILCFLAIAAEEGCEWKSVDGSAPATAPEPHDRKLSKANDGYWRDNSRRRSSTRLTSPKAQFEAAPGWNIPLQRRHPMCLVARQNRRPEYDRPTASPRRLGREQYPVV
jgi:hypothetical protein